jgi:hypothetical protein
MIGAVIQTLDRIFVLLDSKESNLEFWKNITSTKDIQTKDITITMEEHENNTLG